ncbi:hypothetical protein GCM10029992_18980 [Glycomyces albus]
MAEYIDGTDHAATIDARMDMFERALVRRWRRETAERLNRGDSIITSIVRPTYGNIGLEHASGPFGTPEWTAHKPNCSSMPHYLEGGVPERRARARVGSIPAGNRWRSRAPPESRSWSGRRSTAPSIRSSC